MALLEDINLFATVVTRGGFSHAAKYLGLSNGLVSRRIAQLEKKLGVTLLVRTTRQVQLTKEGELLWEHAQRIQNELDAALCVINSFSEKPKGVIRLSAPVYFGRHVLLPILMRFLDAFSDIKIELMLTNEMLDPIKENLDLIIRASGYLDKPALKDSSLRIKLLTQQTIGLYATPAYLSKRGKPFYPDDLCDHNIIGYVDRMHFDEQEAWTYIDADKRHQIQLTPKFKCNDMGSSLTACLQHHGIAKLAMFAVEQAVQNNQLLPVLAKYNWGQMDIYAVYANQHALPKRTRLLLEFIDTHIKA